MNKNKFPPKVELIEDGQIILATQFGVVDYANAKAAIEGVISLLDQANQVTHLISDMTQAYLLPEAAPLTSSSLLKRIENHPKFGLSTMVTNAVKRDLSIEKVMDEYNKRIWKEGVSSPSGMLKRSVIHFNTIEDAKNFLLQVNNSETFSEEWEENEA
jgi:hypothetical protein